MKVCWIIILALVLIGSATFIPVVKTTEGRTTITGTIVTTKAWLRLPPVTDWQPSPLATWCSSHGVAVNEETVFFSKITKNVWGITWSRNSSPTPASYAFTPALQSAWLARTPEADVRRFVEAMLVTQESGHARLIEAAVAQTQDSR